MSFEGNFSNAITTPVMAVEEMGIMVDSDVRIEKIHSGESGGKRNKSAIRTIVLVIISAIIFVTVVAMFEVFRSAFNTYFSNISVRDCRSNNTKEDVVRTTVSNRYSLLSAIIFALFAMGATIVSIQLLYSLV